MIRKISIEVVPHNTQRYETVGDWFFADSAGNPVSEEASNGHVVIRVSDLGNWRQNMCVAQHEFWEILLCHHRGVSVEQVDEFDKQFEAEREAKIAKAKTEAEKRLLLIDEPGDDSDCPYGMEHGSASGVERQLAAMLGVVWAPYEKKIEEL